jgi:hypothetical protein
MHMLGKKPFTGLRPTTPRLRCSALTRTREAVVGPPPASASWSAAVVALAKRWGMDLNDQYGCCVIAAVAHMLVCWSANAGRVVVPSDDDVYKLFKLMSPNLDGCVVQDVLDWLRQNTWCGMRLGNYAALDPASLPQLRDTVSLFVGGLVLGIEMPDAWVAGYEDLSKVPWTVPEGQPLTGRYASNPNNGHCVFVPHYELDAFWPVTWGEEKSLFLAALPYVTEAYVCESPAMLNPSGTTPSGLAQAALDADMAVLPTLDEPEPQFDPDVPPPSPLQP